MKKVSISVFGLVMLMSGAVDGVSNLPSIAIFGQSLIFFFIIASILFLLPTGLVSAELCAQYSQDSGVYSWGKKAFGNNFGLLIVWFQWINTMIWFPTCLTTLIGTVAFLINPALTHHVVFLVSMSLIAFWVMTLVNLKGIKQSAKIASWASSIGMLLPMFLMIFLSLLWISMGKPLAMHLTTQAVVPNLSSVHSWGSLTAVITAFLGMELATVHVKKVNNAQAIFPKAIIYTVLLIAFTMGVGSLGVAMVVPHDKIILVSGTIQAFNAIFIGFHIPWMKDVLGVMLLFGSLGTMVNWLISPAEGLSQAAKNGYLPKSLGDVNKHQVPVKILVLQAVVVSFVLLAFFLLPSVNGSYWLLLDLSTELYVVMYILMFLAALKLTFGFDKIKVIIFGKLGMFLSVLSGLAGCLIVFVVGFFPPADIDVGSSSHYVFLFSSGMFLMTIPALIILLVKAIKKQTNYALEVS